MVVEANFKIGPVAYKIVVDEKNEMDSMHKAIVLANPRTYCNVCKNNQFFNFDTNKATSENGTFTYIKVRCLAKDCGAESTLGQYKTGGYFWKKFEKYERPATQEEGPNE